MWLLNEIKNGQETGQQRLLYPGKTYTVGRRDSTITIEDDKSVSRKHATVVVESTDYETGLQNVLNPSKRCSVTVRDEGAKYGTFVNTSKVSPHQPHELRDNDVIKFGTLTSLWRLTWFPVVICCSGLRSAEKEQIYRAALELDIKISKAWVSDICTHLYMKETRPTEKALLAIADLCPIISLSWIERMRENKDSTNFHFPPVEEHQPPLNAVCDNVPERPNFLPMPRRKTVFTDTTFYVFSEEQYYRIHPLVSKCGGDIVHCEFNISPWDSQESIQQLIAKDMGSNIIYPQSDPNESYDAYHTRWKILFAACHRLGERLIAEVEVGWAVVFGTTDVYCNKYAPEPIEITSQPNEESRSKVTSTIAKGQESISSNAARLQSSFASDISTPVVRSRPPAPPSWVLGDIEGDVEPDTPERHAILSKRRHIDVTEATESNSTATVAANGAKTKHGTSNRNLNAFLDAMFDDLDEVEEIPPANLSPVQSEPLQIDEAPAMNADMPKSSASRNVHIDEHNQQIEDQSVHIRQKVASLADVNRQPWEASSDEGERGIEAQVAPEVTRAISGEELIVQEDENMEPNETEDTIVALIKEKQQSFRAAARRSREVAAEADEAFVPSATEQYSTIVVQSLVKAPPTASSTRTVQADDSVVNYKRFRKTARPQHNEMSYIRMLPHDEMQLAMQEVYWLQRDQPQRRQITRPGSQGGEKLTFD
ncbi:hypothetical protein K450DRAFT_235455 [Umbelopsis ramanniana AG]|uniref:FHA domain-containing protein n=1 Tax=Umbelopsis ramanniana AG TaxID=1314678 RepID=A0AAD5EDI3_UMBRA|nr:uncharacterized protein K450DRAFT_235455 [Umbelopsis ramanniana AG]KAI8580961.1 hypothetical protein K450DRAFT_235455 [Umbelopsis ramanniana AG]